MTTSIRFDRTMKHLLRDKANYGVWRVSHHAVRGEDNHPQPFGERGNREEEYDRVDMLAEDSWGSLMLMEVQNNNEYAYFRRMLFEVSKLVTEYIRRGGGYERVRKVYAIKLCTSLRGMGETSCTVGRRSSAASTRVTFWS